MVVSVAASKLETQDLVSVVASSLTARGFGVSVSDAVWPTLLSSCVTYCIVQTHIYKRVTEVLPMHHSLTKPQPEYPWKCYEHIKSKHDGKSLNCHACIHLSIKRVCVRCCATRLESEGAKKTKY